MIFFIHDFLTHYGFSLFFRNYFYKSPLQTQLKMDSRKMHNKFDYFMFLQSLELSFWLSLAFYKMAHIFITRLLVVFAEEKRSTHWLLCYKVTWFTVIHFYNVGFCVRKHFTVAKHCMICWVSNAFFMNIEKKTLIMGFLSTNVLSKIFISFHQRRCDVLHINVNKNSKSFIHRGMSERILWIEIYADYYLTVFIINWDHFTGKFPGINMLRF